MSEPTIYDVARESGFSIKTVSRVINGGRIAQTVARVESAIKRLDYHPNPAARRLGGGRLSTIGLVVDSLNDPFFGEVIAVVERRAVEMGMDVLVASTGMDAERARTQVERLVRRGVSGLIVAPFGDDASAREALPDDVPVVVIDRQCGIEDKDVVRVTDHEGAHQAVGHLVAHGHRRIAFFGETAEFSTVQDRLVGFTDAMVEAGLEVEPGLVETQCWSADVAYPLALAMLAPADAPTAVFATTPLVGLGVLRALKRLRRQDTAVVVFGDFPLAGHDAAHHHRRPAPRPPSRTPRSTTSSDASTSRTRPSSRPCCPPASCSAGRAACHPGGSRETPLVVDLGFDLGTTVTKLTVAHRGRHAARRPLHRHRCGTSLGDGHAERDPRVVVAAVEDAPRPSRRDDRQHQRFRPLLEIRSIGFASMAEFGVVVDAAASPAPPSSRGSTRAVRTRSPPWPRSGRRLPSPHRPAVSHVASVFRSPGCATRASRCAVCPVALAARVRRSLPSVAGAWPSCR